MRSERIGVFGGTFDPIHNGHLLIAEDVRERSDLDRILFVPASEPPHKAYPEMASASMRADMVEIALEDHPCFEMSAIELKRSGKSYTFETLRELHASLPAAEIFLIMGVDNAAEIDTWCNPTGVLDLARVLVLDRPGFDRDGIAANFRECMEFLESRRVEVSSTEVRRRVREGGSIRYLVPETVGAYIEEKGLYQEQIANSK